VVSEFLAVERLFLGMLSSSGFLDDAALEAAELPLHISNFSTLFPLKHFSSSPHSNRLIAKAPSQCLQRQR
jgi:hypothetical protein